MMKIDYSKVNWHELSKKINNLRVTGLRKNVHTYNACKFKRLAQELDDAVGMARFGYFEGYTEMYVTAAGRDYDINTGRTLETLALLAKHDLARGLQDWHNDYKKGLLS